MKALITCALLFTSAIANAEIARKMNTDISEAQHQAHQEKKDAAKMWRKLMKPELESEETALSQAQPVPQGRG